MQKHFTKEYIQAAKVIVIGLALGLGVSFVSANWTPPLNNAPTCNAGDPGCDAPINISTNIQAKAGANVNWAKLYVHNVFGADNIVATESFNAGGQAAVYQLPDGMANIFGMLTIDRSTKSGGNGRNMLNLVGSADNTNVGVIQNKPWFFFWDYANNSRGSIQAKNGDFDGTLRIAGGNPGLGRVLASDTTGNASWGAINITGGAMTLKSVRADCNQFPSSGVNPVYEGASSNKIGDCISSGSENRVQVYCPAGSVAIGGGGDCEAKLRVTQPIVGAGVAQSANSVLTYNSTNGGGPYGWVVICDQTDDSKDGHAQVLCVDYTTPTAVANVSENSQVPGSGWHSIYLGNSPIGSNPNNTCSQWLTTGNVGWDGNVNHVRVVQKDAQGNVVSTNVNHCLLWYSNGSVSLPGVTTSNPTGTLIDGTSSNGYDYSVELYY